MTKFCSIIFAFLLAASAAVYAGDRPRVRFAYDVGFDFRFDNREYDCSGFSPSMTILGARLTPSAGLRIYDSETSVHRLMLGIDIMKDFGASPVSGEAAGQVPAPGSSGRPSADETSSSLLNLDLFREIIFYYSWVKSFAKTRMTLTAGIFPRKEMEGKYSTAFFSDSLVFYDPNLEGIILKFRRPRAYYEVGCDWMGKYGTARRERFMVFSSGEAALSGILKLGYSGYMYHFAGCENVWGVVDNILLNPYIGLDLSRKTGLQRLEISLGWLQSMQNDRRNVGNYVFPHGGEFLLEARNWNVGLENRLYYGTDLMPYYDNTDAAGIRYGSLLYSGDTFFRVNADRNSGLGFYDRLAVYYEPRIASFLSLRVAAVLHFNGGFSGWQQIVSLKFDLEELLGADRHDSSGKNSRRPRQTARNSF